VRNVHDCARAVLRELDLGDRGAVLRLEQRGYCVKTRSVV